MGEVGGGRRKKNVGYREGEKETESNGAGRLGQRK